jgi:hypothetical protein
VALGEEAEAEVVAVAAEVVAAVVVAAAEEVAAAEVVAAAAVVVVEAVVVAAAEAVVVVVAAAAAEVVLPRCRSRTGTRSRAGRTSPSRSRPSSCPARSLAAYRRSGIRRRRSEAGS